MHNFFWLRFLEAAIYGNLKRWNEFENAATALKEVAPWFIDHFFEEVDGWTFPEKFKKQLLRGIEMGQSNT
jgi:hypothetical protein